MTPEEKAVIEAALAQRTGLKSIFDESPLAQAVDALIFTCSACNAGGHICPGCGESIGHTETACANCDPLVAGVSSTRVDGTTFEEEPRASTPEPKAEKRCPNGGRAWGEPRASTPEEREAEEPPRWVPATLLHCLAGDRIRIGADESDVTRSSSGAWHANVVSSVLPSGKTWDKITPWEHTELRLDLSANPGFRQYPPNTPCEIWMNAERCAVHVIMTGFPGSVIVDNSSVGK